MKSVCSVAVILLLLMLFSFASGPATPPDFWRDVFRGDSPWSDIARANEAIFELRLVHVIVSAAVGCALATAGRAMQLLLQNPLADPHIVGISAGSTASVLLTILFAPSVAQSVLMGWIPAVWIPAFLGALLSFALVRVFLHKCVESWGTPALAMAGLFLNASVSALLMVIFARLSPAALSEVQSWTLGAIQPYSLGQSLALVPFLVVPALYLMKSERALMLSVFGQDFACVNGVNPVSMRTRILMSLTVLSAASVCAAGSIGFVGLLVPHLTRRWIRHSDALWIRPTLNALLGACVLVLADVCSRTLTPPTQLPVGVYTALLATPFLLVVFARARRL